MVEKLGVNSQETVQLQKQINSRKDKEKLLCIADIINEDPKVPTIALAENRIHVLPSFLQETPIFSLCQVSINISHCFESTAYI